MVIKQNLALGVGSGVFTGFSFFFSFPPIVFILFIFSHPSLPLPSGVRVIVLQGRNLPSRDSNRLSDPFVKLQLGETKKKTRVRRWGRGGGE